MASEIIELPKYTLEDFSDGTAPFDFLYGLEDRFTQERMIQRMKVQAKQVGYNSFMSVWKAYRQSKSGTEDQTDGHLSEFEGLPEGVAQFQTGNYICDTDGVKLLDNYGFPVTVCPHPIAPVRRYINVDNGEEYLEIWFCKYASKERRITRSIVVSKDDISNSISKLAKYGIVVNPRNAKYLSAYLLDIEQYNYSQIEEKQSVTRLGWIGDNQFSPYVESVRFDGEEDFGSIFSSVGQAGDYEAWKDAIRKVRAEKTAARIYLAASFASVILKPCGLLPFMVHLWGTSEIGKSVALMIAASVWANPEIGEYVTTYNGTRYAQETKAAFLNNLPLCLDELQIQASQGKTDFDDTIYQLCEGVSKAQGKASGGLRKQLRWKNVILSNGEHPIVKGLSGGGAANRVIEIESAEPIYSDLVGLCDIIKANYGHAGREVVEWLQDGKNLEKVKEIQKNYYETLREGNATDKQIASASAILAADNIVTELIFQDDMCLTVEDITQVLLSRSEMDANRRTCEWLLDYVSSNRLHFDADAKTEIWGEIEGETIWFIRSVFERELKSHGQDPKSFLSWAKQKDVIECESGRRDKVKRVSGTTLVTRCVVIKVQKILDFMPIGGENDSEKLPF